MHWVEISVAVDHEAAEPTSALLSRYGSVAVEEIRATPTSGDPIPPAITVRCYLTAEQAAMDREAISQGLWHLSQMLPIGEPVFRDLTERDWTEAWKEYFPVLHIGERVVIVPTWRQHEAQPGEIVLALDPGMAFGTGLHPSTQLCLKALERHLQPGDEVLDVGTGTGILSIAAVKMGAARAEAMDIDPTAVEAARENVVRNEVQGQVQVSLGSVVPVRSRQGPQPALVDSGAYDLTLANIIAEVISEMAPALCRLTCAGGTIVTAGIIAEREHLVLDAFRDRAELLSREQDGDWVCLCFRNPPG